MPAGSTGLAFWRRWSCLLDMVVVRLIFAIVLTITAYYFQPFGLPKLFSAIYGVIASAAIILFEARLRKVSLKRLIGAAIGSTLGFLAATMISSMLAKTSIEPRTLSFLQIGLFLLMGYVGLVSGANKGDMLNLAALGGLFGGERPPSGATRFWTPASLSTVVWPTSAKPVLWTASW